MNIRLEIIASIVAIAISIGTIFYHGVVVKRDVEHLTSQNEKKGEVINKIIEKIHKNEKELSLLQSQVKLSTNQMDKTNNYLTEINKKMVESSEETRKFLLQKFVESKK